MLHLFFITTWMKMDQFEFEPHEHVLCVKQVYLPREEVNEEDDLGINDDPIDIREKDLIPYIAVGTGVNESEGSLCKGRVILFDMEPKLNTRRNRFVLKIVTSKELKGLVSQVCTNLEAILVSVWDQRFMFIISIGQQNSL
jgi:hypothetical protein